MPIKKGATWSFSIEPFTDDSEATPVDISEYEFVMTATYANGTTAFTKDNTAFIAATDHKRTLTLSKTDTAALTVGELYYQIDVTYPDTTAQEWMQGFIIVQK